MPSHFFTNCFGKQKSFLRNSIGNVTEVKRSNQNEGNFLLHSFENSLREAAAIKSITRLENEIEKAKKSGLLARSEVYAEHQYVLQCWKHAVDDVIRTSRALNRDALFDALQRVRSLSLVDEGGHQAYGEAVFTILMAKNNLQEAIEQESLQLLKKASEEYDEAREKLEAHGGQHEIDQTLLSSTEIKSAKKLMEAFSEENILFFRDTDYPKLELQKAVNTRCLEDLDLSLKRWRRLKLDVNDQNYLEAVKLVNQIVHQRKLDAVQCLEKSLKTKNSEDMKNCIKKAKDVQVDEFLVNLYQDTALPILEKCYEKAKEIIVIFKQQTYASATEVLATAMVDESFVEEKLLNAINDDNKAERQKDWNDESVSDISKAVKFVKLECDIILLESKNAFRVTQRLLNSFKAKELSLNVVKKYLEKVLETLKSFVNEYGDGSRLNDDMPLSNRRSLLQSPKDRLILSRDVASVLSEFPDLLVSSITSCRQAMKNFKSSLKQSNDLISAWEKRRFISFTDADKPEAIQANLTFVEDAEKVQSVIQRLVQVAKAENSLTFFETSSPTPRDRTEMENIAVHIKEGLKILSHSDHISDSNQNFVDLCYNRSDSKLVFSNRDKFPNAVTALKCFSILFPERLMVATKKAAEIQLVELRLFCADEEARQNSARYALDKAIAAHSEKDIVTALRSVAFPPETSDPTFVKAEKELNKIRLVKASCKDALRIAIGKKDEEKLQEAIANAESLGLSVSEPLLLSAKQALELLQFRKNRQNSAIEELRQASFSNNNREIRVALAKAKARGVPENNSFFLKAHQNLEHHRLLKKFSEEKDQKFFVSLKQKINYSDQELIDFKVFVVTPASLSSRQISNKEKRSTPVKKTFIQYLQNEIDAVLNLNASQRLGQDHLHLLLKYAEKEKKEIPKDIFKASKSAMKLVSERKVKAQELQNKLQEALREESYDDLASAIASADADPEQLACKVSENSEELFELTAKAKECFALLNLQRKSEEKEKVQQHLTLARKKLKKVMLQDGNGNPLREAVETFRLVCSSISPCFPNENNGPKRKTNATPKIFTIRKNSNKTSDLFNPEKKVVVSKQEERFLGRTKKLYRTASLNKGLRNKPVQQIQGQSVRRTGSMRIMSGNPTSQRIEKNRNFSGKFEKEKRRALSARPYKPEQKPKISNSTEVINNITKPKSNSTKSVSIPRPASAPEDFFGDNDFTLPPKTAWNEIDKKNIALLRKAEKSLKKKEKENEKRKEDAEEKEFLDSIKDELLNNLQTSVNSGERAELWQAVHEYSRYFGNESQNNIFVRAKAALHESTFHQYKENLDSAVAERNQEKLHHVLYEIENDSSNYLPKNEEKKEKFLKDISDAKQLAAHLGNLERYKESVMRMTRSLVSEINSYSSPPDVIKSVMAATYLLLGESEKTVKDWRKLHPLLSRLGRFSLTRCVVRCTPQSISLSSCRLASQYLANLKHERVNAISVGAGIFFAWSKCMIFEVFSRHGEIPNEDNSNKEENLKSSSQQQAAVPSNEFLQRLARSTRYTSPPKRLGRENKNGMNKRARALSARI